VVEALGDAEELITTIDVLAEVNIVALIDIALIHVTSEQALKNLLRGADSEKIEHTQELILGHMTVAGDVVVLEHWFQVNALVLDLSAVRVENVFDFLGHGSTCQILSASQERVVFSDRGNASRWSLVNTRDRERRVNVFAEVGVTEEALRISSLVLFSERLKLVVGKIEVHGREDRFELGPSNATLAQLVEIAEEFFDADAFHHNDGLQPLFDLSGVVRDDDMALHIAVVDDINIRGGLLEEGGDLLGAHANLLELLRLRVLSVVRGEHV